jgi:pimeloyl-ACP methyl ester carboxylesterase
MTNYLFHTSNLRQRGVRFAFLAILLTVFCGSPALHAQALVNASPLPVGATSAELDSLPRRPIAELLLPYKFPVKKLRVKRGTEIAYVDEGNPKSKQVLLFIHGVNTYSPVWNKTIEDLSRDYRCVAVDLPGFGRSEKGIFPVNIFFYADLLTKFLDGLRIRSDVTIVGHSMGAQIALNLALRYTSRYKRLILIAPSGVESFSQQERQAFYDNVKDSVIKEKTDDMLRADFGRMFFKVPPDAEFMLRDRLAMRRASDYGAYCHVVARSIIGMVELPTWDMLEGVSQPTLLIFGRFDKLIPNQFFHVLQKPQDVLESGKNKIRRSVPVLLDKCGHVPQWEQAEAVNQAIRDFLGR